MAFKISNDLLELDIQEPGSVYRGARFDWTGQITQITFNNKNTFCTDEILYTAGFQNIGRGLYNEFGIDEPIGFDDCPVGAQFPKIGVGLLTKNSADEYDFFNPYKVLPGHMTCTWNDNSVEFTWQIDNYRGYAFELTKSITLSQNTFAIKYQLRNEGEKEIRTNEYVHNFLAIDNKHITTHYELKFPFNLDSVRFLETVNPDNAVRLKKDTLTWYSQPTTAFFYSMHLHETGLPGSWALQHRDAKIGIRESCNSQVDRINIWGTKHVVSPEIFHRINLPPGSSDSWQRKYEIFTL